jgi:Tripartite tricarboxylate transporter family receptor
VLVINVLSTFVPVQRGKRSISWSSVAKSAPNAKWRPKVVAQPILNYLIEQFQKILNLPETKTKLDALNAEVFAYNGQKFDALIEAEFKRWGELIRKRKIGAATVRGPPNKVSLGIT